MKSLNEDKDLWTSLNIEKLENREEYVAVGCCVQGCCDNCCVRVTK